MQRIHQSVPLYLYGCIVAEFTNFLKESTAQRSTMSDGDIIKCSSMVKRAQGKSSFGATNFRKRFFVLTPLKLSYYDGNLEVSSGLRTSHATCRSVCTDTFTVFTRTCTYTCISMLAQGYILYMRMRIMSCSYAIQFVHVFRNMTS